MKVTLFVLIISSFDIFLHFTVCQDESLINDPILTKSYPKKIKKLDILNPRKFLKVRSGENLKRNLKKHSIRKDGYTYFPAIANNQGSLDSPFFRPEHDIEPKIRVKKVLPDYFRNKRSVKKNDKEESKNVIRKRENRSNTKSKDIKHEDTRKPKTKKQSAQKNKESKVRSTNDKAKTTPRLRHSVKQSNNKSRGLRKGKRDRRERPGNKRNQKRQKIDNSLKKRKQQKKKDARRLIAGKDAMIADYPYVVSIQKGGQHWCAGALVNQRLVITTANCIWKSDHISRLRIRAGTRHADRGGQVAKIQEVMKHPRWSIRKNPDNDVALILLDRNIKFSDKVHSLDLPNHAMLPSFEDAWVTSWGAERRDGIFENTRFTLQVYHTRLMNHDKCNNVTQRFGVRVSENFICLTQTGRRAPCTRDTGAPAVSDGILWGLASWGIRKLCGTERFPAMFSYLASPSNLQFITNATHHLMSEQRFYPFPDRFDVQRVVTTTEVGSPAIDYML